MLAEGRGGEAANENARTAAAPVPVPVPVPQVNEGAGPAPDDVRTPAAAGVEMSVAAKAADAVMAAHQPMPSLDTDEGLREYRQGDECLPTKPTPHVRIANK